MIRALSILTMAAVVALVSDAPAWLIYVLGCLAAAFILIGEPKK
jgi:hypothetical protein